MNWASVKNYFWDTTLGQKANSVWNKITGINKTNALEKGKYLLGDAKFQAGLTTLVLSFTPGVGVLFAIGSGAVAYLGNKMVDKALYIASYYPTKRQYEFALKQIQDCQTSQIQSHGDKTDECMFLDGVFETLNKAHLWGKDTNKQKQQTKTDTLNFMAKMYNRNDPDPYNEHNIDEIVFKDLIDQLKQWCGTVGLNGQKDNKSVRNIRLNTQQDTETEKLQEECLDYILQTVNNKNRRKQPYFDLHMSTDPQKRNMPKEAVLRVIFTVGKLLYETEIQPQQKQEDAQEENKQEAATEEENKQ